MQQTYEHQDPADEGTRRRSVTALRNRAYLATFTALITLLGFMLLLSCTTKYYKKSADKEVYKILDYKGQKIPGMDPSFTIEREPFDPLEGLPRRYQPLPSEQAELDQASTETLGSEASQTGQASLEGQSTEAQEPPAIISLARALGIAVANSRDYQSQKESVYLEALSLTYQRYRWRPRFSGWFSGLWRKSNDEQTQEFDTDFGMNLLLADGASIAVDLGSSFLRHLTGDPRETAASVLSASVIQPLLRGA